MVLSSHNLIKWFQLKYPKLVKDMKNCDHHYSSEKLNTYHLEGDVFTHTMMVVLMTQNELISQFPLNEEENYLLVAALLHDIGKVFARRPNHDKQRVHFFGHDAYSAFLSTGIIKDIEEDFDVELDKQLLFYAIALHTELFKLDAKQQAERFKGNIGLHRFLQLLSKADQYGRFHNTENVFHRVPTIAINMFEKKPLECVMMIGLPNSGKSTYLEGKYDGYRVLSRDSIVEEEGFQQGATTYDAAFKAVDQKQVDKIFESRLQDALKNKQNIIIDKTNLTRKSRRKVLNRLSSDYKKTAVLTLCDFDDILKRNGDRAISGKTIPSHVYEKMISSFYPPLYDEFNEIIVEGL